MNALAPSFRPALFGGHGNTLSALRRKTPALGRRNTPALSRNTPALGLISFSGRFSCTCTAGGRGRRALIDALLRPDHGIGRRIQHFPQAFPADGICIENTAQ